ncbi:GFA family protein [Devosia sp. 919]|uniref:GFA family protein n=1 Tax=Devosia sp. 919 TaxID=2726065 RepID=UPI0015575535|nr:GFA family protein [Devosia sp. 919]
MSKQDRVSVNVKASCACGALTMAIVGPVGSMFMCACLHCQQASGTGHSTVALVSEQHLIVSGQAGSFSRPSASGATFTRHFCPCCGTPLYGQSSRAPSVRLVAAGFFAGDNAWFVPNQLIFARTHQGWDSIADHLPHHETYRPSPA